MDAQVPYNQIEVSQQFRFEMTHQQARHVFQQWADRLARRGCIITANANTVAFCTERDYEYITTDFIYNVRGGHRVYQS